MKIYLIGLPGSGKSVLGKRLSQAINLPFIDLDAEVERQAGSTIAVIFESKSQDYFRNVEAEVLRLKSMEKEFVMATGGGTPCFHSNMEFMNQTGVSIFLDTPIENIAARISAGEKQKRPLLEGVPDNELIQKLEWLLHQRKEFYLQAHLTVNGATATPWELLQLLNTRN